MKILITYDSVHDVPSDTTDYEYLDLRHTDLRLDELMTVYESIEVRLISWLRSRIIDSNPDVIITVGTSQEYRWIGTVVCRVFGQFNSWRGQQQHRIGKTELLIHGKSVVVLAIDSFDDLNDALSLVY